MEIKDYFSLSFSGVALALSMYNLWRASRVESAIAKQKLDQMKFDAITWVIDARSSIRDARESLEAAYFEARTAKDPDVALSADEHIKSLDQALINNAAIEAGLRGMPTATADGTSTELQAMEGVLGTAKTHAAGAKDEAKSAAAVAEVIRRKLRAAKAI